MCLPQLCESLNDILSRKCKLMLFLKLMIKKLRLPAREYRVKKVNSQEGQVLISVFLFIIV